MRLLFALMELKSRMLVLARVSTTLLFSLRRQGVSE
jgi:hypothetical protein